MGGGGAVFAAALAVAAEAIKLLSVVKFWASADVNPVGMRGFIRNNCYSGMNVGGGAVQVLCLAICVRKGLELLTKMRVGGRLSAL